MNSALKNAIKRVLPAKARNAAKEIRGGFQSYQLSAYDRKRFRKYQNQMMSADPVQISSLLTFHAHALEKGLSHQDLRLGFGKDNLTALVAALSRYDSQGFDQTALAYRNALSVLHAYVSLHKDRGHDLAQTRTLLGPYYALAEAEKSPLGGVIQFPDSDKSDNPAKPFNDLFLGRFSVREFADEPVNMDSLYNALAVCLKTPSVCNRQSARVHVLTDPGMISSALKIQGGFNGYKAPPLLLVVTTDTRAFVEAKERNQPWIDGGLYSMSLLLALEATNIAACPLNAMMLKQQEQQVRELIGLKDYENIIMFIAAGNFLPLNISPRSYREPLEAITFEQDA